MKKTMVPKIEIQNAESTGPDTLEVTWKRVSNVSGYQVQLAEDQGFTEGRQTKKESSKKGSLIFPDLKYGQSYYVRARAWKNVSGGTVYGPWSDIINVNIEEPADPTDIPHTPTGVPQTPTVTPPVPTVTPPVPTVTPPQPTEGPVKDLEASGFSVYLYTNGRNYIYTGSAFEPEVRVYKLGGESLIRDRDYTVAYSDNINAGQATVTIRGTGNYTGTLTENFQIQKAGQSFVPEVEDGKVYIGKPKKMDLTGAYGELEFQTSQDGIVEVSSDGMVTGIRPGRVRIYVSAGGDENHTPSESHSIYLTILNEEASSYGFDCIATSYNAYKKQSIDSRNSDGTNTYEMFFFCDSDEEWIDQNISFVAEDVTPSAYARVFEEMGTVYSGPEITMDSANDYLIRLWYSNYNVTIWEPYREGSSGAGETAMSGKKIFIKAGAGVRAVKLTARQGDQVLDTVYLGSDGCDKNGEYSAYDLDLYGQVRRRIEARIWRDDMSNLDKIRAMADYINKTTHYPGTDALRKEYNPTFWDEWSVDDKELLYYMFSDVVLNRIMDLQGGILDCQAAVSILKRAADEDMGLAYLYNGDTDEIAAGEGVYIGNGRYSSSPGNPYHSSLIYKSSDEEKYFIDAQGNTYNAGAEDLTCEAHGCKDHIVPLR